MQRIDAVYVLSVKTFTDRIAHIRQELGRQQIEFEFIFDYDADELQEADLARTFEPGKLGLPHRSLVLKHAQAWKLALARGQQRILVLEDDVVLSPRFKAGIAQALDAADQLAPAYLIFLGGADTKVPDAFFLAQGPLFPLPLPTAEGYVTDAVALQRRIAWLAEHRVDLPADHLINRIDRECGIGQYWVREPIVEQGSVFGMFTSELDQHRLKHSPFYNSMRYRWNRFQRRRLRAWRARLRAWLA
jgi:glycosyl transferase, family 25